MATDPKLETNDASESSDVDDRSPQDSPADSGHSDADTQAERNREDESPS